jgi:hypothetical protein
VLVSAVCLGIVIYVVLNLLFNHEDIRAMKDVLTKDGRHKR